MLIVDIDDVKSSISPLILEFCPIVTQILTLCDPNEGKNYQFTFKGSINPRLFFQKCTKFTLGKNKYVKIN